MAEGTLSEGLARLGVELPPAPAPVASYIPSKRIGSQVFVSGQIPIVDGALIAQGLVPDDVDLETAQRCARQCALNVLACAAAAAGGVDMVRSVVRLGIYVACGSGYTDHPTVANGASDLMLELMGEAGRHTRAAVGVASLPLGAPVEIDAVIEVG